MLKAHALHAAAREIADLVGPIETTNDRSISLQAQLISRAIDARMGANLPAETGHDAILRMAASLAASIQARTEFLAAHQELAGLRDALRVPRAFGTGDGCPPASGVHLVAERDVA